MAAKTYFCYGIPVTNESLTLATMAYSQLEGPFRFIRLVQKRIREGSFLSLQPSAAGSLPIELWDLVRHKVTDLELGTVEREFVDTHACAEHCTQFCVRECDDTRPAERWTDMVAYDPCDLCLDNLIAYKGFLDPALTEKCRLLLRDYGLDMPSTHVLKTSQPDPWYPAEGDPNSVIFVAVSPSSPADRIDADDHVSCEHPEVDDMDNFHNDGIWPVSLDKPADADQRFRHLLRDLHLTPLKVSDGTIGIARANRTLEQTYEKISAAEVQPQWHLFTTVECDWL